MNKRLRELANEAGLPTYNPEGIPTKLERFAELIVQECADIGNNHQDILGNEPKCFNCRKVAYGIVDKIKQHFEVEE